ncbi:MAG: hypothetical protein ACK4UV_12210, partial [Ignavibacterium sp.]
TNDLNSAATSTIAFNDENRAALRALQDEVRQLRKLAEQGHMVEKVGVDMSAASSASTTDNLKVVVGNGKHSDSALRSVVDKL